MVTETELSSLTAVRVPVVRMSSQGSIATGTVRSHPLYPPDMPNDRQPVVPQKPMVQALVMQSVGAAQFL